MKNILVLLMVLTFAACSSTAQISEDGYYGESFEVKNYIKVDEVTAQLATQDTLQTLVKGKVESVCQKKGCWMNIVSEEGESIFVKFKDYGFFMPLDLAGSEVVMNGKAFKEVTSVEELKNYAEDEGLSKEEIDKIVDPEEEYKFLATGVFVEQ